MTVSGEEWVNGDKMRLKGRTIDTCVFIAPGIISWVRILIRSSLLISSVRSQSLFALISLFLKKIDWFSKSFAFFLLQKLLILSVTLLYVASATNGYKTLLLTPVNGKSHWLFMQHIIKALLDRHHEVTVVTSLTWSGAKP